MSTNPTWEIIGPHLMDYLIHDYGLTDFQAAGIAGNAGGESEGWTVAQERGKPWGRGGLGPFQWTNPGRRTNYENWIRAHGGEHGTGGDPRRTVDALDFDIAYSFLKHEFATTERATIPAVRAAKDLESATRAFMVAFERPGIPNISGRIGWAQSALAAYRRRKSTPDQLAPRQVDYPEIPPREKETPAMNPAFAFSFLLDAVKMIASNPNFQQAAISGVQAIGLRLLQNIGNPDALKAIGDDLTKRAPAVVGAMVKGTRAQALVDPRFIHDPARDGVTPVRDNPGV